MQSSTEAEYVSATQACQECKVIDIGIVEQKRTVLFEDNQGCVKLLHSETINSQTKHIDEKYHLLRDLQENGLVELEYCPRNKMLTDVLTKPVTRD